MVTLPPLRTRPEDVPLLVRHFLNDSGASDREVDSDALEQLCLHDWPRNVRELQAAVERALFGAEDATMLTVEHFAPFLRRAARAHEPEAPAPAPTPPASPEAEALKATLTETAGDVEAAARRLGISRSQLYRRAQRYDIAVASFRKR